MLLGRAIAITDKKDPEIPAATLLEHFSDIMSASWIKIMYSKYAKRNIMRYNPHLAMEDQDIEKIYMGEILVVSESVRGLNLGRALTMQSIEMAKKKDCEGYLGLLTGIYSQKIFSDLDFSFIKELAYADFKDKDGNVILEDTREHTSMKTCFKKL